MKLLLIIFALGKLSVFVQTKYRGQFISSWQTALDVIFTIKLQLKLIV